MSQQELIDEFSGGVRMYGYHHNHTLIGVIGIQKIKCQYLREDIYEKAFSDLGSGFVGL